MSESETEQLMDAVRKQVEYYFSKENLQSDAYLTSHMDANMTVAIATVMKVDFDIDEAAAEQHSIPCYCVGANLYAAEISSIYPESGINLNLITYTCFQFAKMKALTQDEALLRKALERSTINIVDDRIKPNIKAAGRSTIILREIPSDTAESEVREIFAFEGCKQISSMRSDIGDTWCVLKWRMFPLGTKYVSHFCWNIRCSC